LNRFSKKLLLHFVGVVLQVTSAAGDRVFPSLCHSGSSSRSPSPRWAQLPLGTDQRAVAAPWVLPKLCPPAMSATVSSSSIAMRLKVSRMSTAAATGSGEFGPFGFT
jgi:hypothetical protein